MVDGPLEVVVHHGGLRDEGLSVAVLRGLAARRVRALRGRLEAARPAAGGAARLRRLHAASGGS